MLKLSESSLMMDIRIAGWKKELDLLKRSKKEVKKDTGQVKTVREKKKRKMPLKKMMAVLRSFRVKQCRIVTDTGDMPLNGMLFPAFYGLSIWTGKTFAISFEDQNEIRLEIKNNLGRMLWTYIRS
jgi:hypothetical protein